MTVRFRKLQLKFALLCLQIFDVVNSQWLRSSLIYHDPNRSSEAFKRHVMRINAAGLYTGTWIFDATILTAVDINGKDIYYGSGFTETDFNQTLDAAFQNAAALDNAIKSLISQGFSSPPSKLLVSICVPYFNADTKSLRIGSKVYDLSIPADRQAALKWYIDQMISRQLKTTWQNLKFYGAYYHREDLFEPAGDVSFIQFFNQEIHRRNLKTVWVPYYDAPYAWGKNTLGFDTVVVQPRYSFLSSIDGGDIRGDRLYSSGYKAAGLGQCFEYEVRSRGESQVENWVAHQYLAIAQFTGASKFPQVFFVGQIPDIFDTVTNQNTAVGDSWWAYNDLAGYLSGDSIANLEIDIPWAPVQIDTQTLKQFWAFPTPKAYINSIRVDFNEQRDRISWQGRVTITVNGKSPSVYSQRVGTDDINPTYNAVIIPLPITLQGDIRNITIRLTKEANSPWPVVLRVIAAEFEPPLIANPIYQKASTGTIPANPGTYSDSKDTHLGFVAGGKLTDGKVSTNADWWSGLSVGWNMINSRFTVILDLGQAYTISTVRISTFKDSSSGINWPASLAAMVAANCEPQAIGTTDKSCQPTASSGAATLVYQTYASSYKQNGSVSLPMYNVKGRYVTVTGICFAWCLMDEIEILDQNNNRVSVGKPYRLTPKPNDAKRVPNYSDNSELLTDGVIATQWLSGAWVDGIIGNQQSVVSTWDSPISTSGVIVWVIPTQFGGIVLPPYLNIQLRDEFKQWKSNIRVNSKSSCGPAPCVKLDFAVCGVINPTKITGVKVNFPDTSSWFMVSEISVY